MGTIDISLLHSRLRLSRGVAARDWLARVDAIQSDLVGTHLEPALAPFAMTDEVVCVRRIALPLRLSGAVTDWQASLQWSALIAGELQRILARNAPDEVLRFPHELAARQAFLADALGGRDERDWAWRQLGWLPAGTTASHRERLDAAIATGSAAAIVPLLRGLAGAGLLPALARVLDGAQSDRLLIDALAAMPDAAAAALMRWADEGGRVSGQEVEAVRPVPSTRTAPGAAFAALLRDLSEVRERRVWAVLAVVCCEPHRLRTGSVEAVAVAETWLSAAVAPSLHPQSSKAEFRGGPQSRSASEPGGSSRARAPGGPAEPSPTPRRQGGAAGMRASPAAHEMAEDRPSVVPGPVEGETGFGGLLFLLPLVAETGALDRMLAEPALTAWPLAAMLHRLALTLAPPLRATDPAALAFAGLPPDAAPPDAMLSNDWRRTPDAVAALGGAAALVLGELTARLPQWAGPALLQRVVQRFAVIAADPGWIEVRFRMVDVSVDLRRAALDLDPGFLPWLGIVLRYRYA